MSDCHEFRPMITALLDRELSAGDAARVEEHLQTCKPCAQVFAECGTLQNAAGMAHLPQTVDLWSLISNEISGDAASSMVEEMRLMRLEMKTLREEVTGLRRELAQSKTPQLPRSIVLNLPDARPLSRYRLV